MANGVDASAAPLLAPIESFLYKKAIKMSARFLRRLALLGFVLALAGCGKQSGSQPNTGHPLSPSPLVAQCEPGQPGGRFVIALPTSPNTFNPLFATNGASDAITRLLFGTLVNLNLVTQEPGPGLAESWAVAADQKTWTVKLRQGVRWSDGQPFGADDVIFTWNSIMYNPEFNRITLDLFRINGRNFEVSKVDDFTVRVVTPEVFAPFIEFFGITPILPRHVLEGAVKEQVFPMAYGIKSRPERIVGCGPYRVKEVRLGQFTLLERNPEYWVADRQGRRLPYFDEVMFTVAGGPGDDARSFLEGKSDVFETVRPENYMQFKEASVGAGFQLVDLGVGAERDFLWFNQNTGTDAQGKPIVNPAKLKWFRNQKFRQAVSCAIDRDRIVREVYGGRAQAIYGFLSTENPRWNNSNTPRFAFDPARARALLGEIGIKPHAGDGQMVDAEGIPIEFVFYSNAGNPLRERAALLIQEDLQKLGLKATYVPLDFRGLVTRINVTFDYEAALMGLGGGGADPASQVNVLRSSEELHQWFPFQKTPSTDWEARIDSLMDAQMRTLDFAQRKKDFDEVQVILADELPMIYTVSPFTYSAIRSGVGNLRPAMLSAYHLTWNLEELYFKKQGR
jgi:peptide/nickel transport system substrate-binding protein